MTSNDDSKDQGKDQGMGDGKGEKKPPRPNPWPDHLKLKDLATAVRVNEIVVRIWKTSFTEEERQKITADESMGPDIIDIWAKFKGVSPTRAVLELAREANLLADQDFHRLLRSFGEEVKPTESPPLPVWDKALGELRLGNTVIKRVRRLKVATNASLILDAFQELGWPPYADDPCRRRRACDRTARNGCRTRSSRST
jgi:hypothetical protein